MNNLRQPWLVCSILLGLLLTLTVASWAPLSVASAPASSQTNFTFALASVAFPDVIILNGEGKFNFAEAVGHGSFTHFNATTGAIVGVGTWKARMLLSFTPTSPPTLGAHAAGVLEMLVDLVPEGGSVISGATMKVVCNLPGLDTGQVEGVTLAIPGGPTFGPTGNGTLFSTGVEEGR